MADFIEGENRFQATLFLERLDDYIAEDNAVRVSVTLLISSGGSATFSSK